MRGDQLARWRMIRAVEANSNGVTETERAKQRETASRTIYLDLGTLQGVGFPLHTKRVEPTNRRAIIDVLGLGSHRITSYLENRFCHAKPQRPPRKRFEEPFAIFAPLREESFWVFFIRRLWTRDS